MNRDTGHSISSIPVPNRSTALAMTNTLGPLYHVLIKTPPLSVRGKASETLRGVKSVAKRHRIPNMISKIGPSSGLVYAETRNKLALQRFEEDIRRMTNYKQRFVTIIPTMEAPVPEDRPIGLPGQRFVDVEGLANFGNEMARRSLWDCWANVIRKGYFKD